MPTPRLAEPPRSGTASDNRERCHCEPDVALAVRAFDVVEVRPHGQDRSWPGGAPPRSVRATIELLPSAPSSSRARSCHGPAAPRPRTVTASGACSTASAFRPSKTVAPARRAASRIQASSCRPGNDPAVAGNPVNLRDPHHGRLGGVDVQSQPSHPARRGERLGLGDAKVGELCQRHRTDEVAADLVAREAGPVDQHGPEPSCGQLRGGRRPGRAAADHDDIAIVPGRPGAHTSGRLAGGGLAVRLHGGPSTRRMAILCPELRSSPIS